MTRLPTIYEVLKEHNNAFFTLLNSNGEEIFIRPHTARQVRADLDKKYLGCTVSELNIEEFLGVEFITATLAWHF